VVKRAFIEASKEERRFQESQDFTG